MTVDIDPMQELVHIKPGRIARIKSTSGVIRETGHNLNGVSHFKPSLRELINASRGRADLWRKIVGIIGDVHRETR